MQIPETSRLQDSKKLEINELKRQAKLLNNPDTFSQCAKLERKALALEKEIAKAQADEKEARSNVLLRIPNLIRIVGLIGIFVLSFKIPIALALEPEWMWPIGRWLHMGTGEQAYSGFVGLVPWAIVCHRATKILVGPRTT